MQFALSILENNTGEENQAYIDDVREEVELMSKLVSELLTYSKAGITAPEIKLERLNLRPLVEQLIERESGEYHDRFRIEINEDLKVLAHRELLNRALGNIIRNAVRYAGHAGTISVSAESCDHQVRISIADQGPGVPEASLEKLFDPFYRIESDRSRQTGGTGLGLAIVKTCIEACRGKVYAVNRNPTGLELIITLT